MVQNTSIEYSRLELPGVRPHLRKIDINNYDELFENLETIEKSNPNSPVSIYIFFIGIEDEEYWCPISEKVAPIVFEFTEQMPPQGEKVLMIVRVPKDTFIDSFSPYYLDPRIKLDRIPTLIEWNRHQNLYHYDCGNWFELTNFFGYGILV